MQPSLVLKAKSVALMATKRAICTTSAFRVPCSIVRVTTKPSFSSKRAFFFSHQHQQQQRSYGIPKVTTTVPLSPSSSSSAAAATTTTNRAVTMGTTSRHISAESTSTITSSASAATTTTTTTTSKPLKGFRQYAQQFKSQPASYLISFGILHEITVIIPLGMIYSVLSTFDIRLPISETVMQDANKMAKKITSYYGWDIEGIDGAKMLLDMTTSYAVVKMLLPVRIAACVWMTPWVAKKCVGPVLNVWKRFRK